MDFVARWLKRLTYDRIAYEPVREDFLSWYREAYYDLSVAERLPEENSELVNMALEARGEALSYESENGLSMAVRYVENARALISLVTAAISLLGCGAAAALLGLGLSDLLPSLLSAAVMAVGGTILLLLAPAYPLYRLIKHTVETNEELIRQYNEELVVPRGRVIQDGRWPDRLTSYYVLHSSLCSTVKVPVVVVLGVIRTVSPKVYGIISARVRSGLSDYHQQSVWETLGKEYARIRNYTLYQKYSHAVE